MICFVRFWECMGGWSDVFEIFDKTRAQWCWLSPVCLLLWSSFKILASIRGKFHQFVMNDDTNNNNISKVLVYFNYMDCVYSYLTIIKYSLPVFFFFLHILCSHFILTKEKLYYFLCAAVVSNSWNACYGVKAAICPHTVSVELRANRNWEHYVTLMFPLQYT